MASTLKPMKWMLTWTDGEMTGKAIRDKEAGAGLRNVAAIIDPYTATTSILDRAAVVSDKLSVAAAWNSNCIWSEGAYEITHEGLLCCTF